MNDDTIKALFQNLLEMPAGKRPEFLDRVCGDDAAARSELESLLRDHEAAGDFLSDPTGGGVRPAEEPAPEAGTVIGPYRLVERIGEGGFGVVYVAEQSAPVRRRVALKVIKAGMDTREVVSRFEAEKQALALMDHPHIARVYDAGSTPGGRPYFVMELVQGVPIQEYCDQCRLPVRERLDLFAEVCVAVQHAHERGVIHRDLKPSNILVTVQDGRPVPKVIDFGVAKATGVQLTEATFQTRFAQMIGTPQYMSPEQAEMSALGIDTRSDVYSLGVVLYELLTGTTPFTLEEMRQATFDELRHMIREQDPPTPSARLSRLNGQGRKVARARRTDVRRLAKAVHGELDWIVMKALEKDRARRYESASRLADDIDRYLENKPVEAGPPGVLYRGRKFARRHRAALSIGAVLFIALASAGWFYFDRVAEREEIASAIRTSLADAAAAHGKSDLDATRAAVQRAEGLVAAGKADPELASAVRTWRDDLDMLERLDAARMARAAVKDDIFDRARGTRAYREAFAAYGADVASPRAAVARIRESRIRENLVIALEDWIDSGMGPAVPPSMRDGRLGSIARRQHNGDLPWTVLDDVDPEPWRRRLRAATRAGDRAALCALAAEPDVRQQRPTTRTFLAHALVRNDELALAVKILRQAQEAFPGDFWVSHDLATQLLRLDPDARREVIGYYRAAIAIRADSPGVYVNLGAAQEDDGDLEAAERSYRKALELKPDYVSARLGIAAVLEAREEMDAALEQFREAVRRAPQSAWAKGVLADAYRRRKRYDDTIRTCGEAAELDPGSPIYHTSLGILFGFELGDWKRARAAFREAVDRDSESAEAVTGLGNALRELGEFEEALGYLKRAVELDPDSAVMIYNLGVGYYSAGDRAKAEAKYREAIAADSKKADARNNLGTLLLENGDVAGAIEQLLVAVEVEPRNAMWLANLAIAYAEADDHERALQTFLRAIDVDSEHAMARGNFGSYLLDRGKPAEALPHLEKAVALDRDLGLRHLNLGIAYEQLERIDEAIRSFRSATAAAQPFPGAWANLAYALNRRDGPKAAIEAFQKAVAYEPKNAQYRLDLGHCYTGTQDYRHAVEAYRKARELGHPASHQFLTQVLYHKLRDRAGALEAFQMWIKAQPENASAHYNLGMLYAEIPSMEDARRCFAEAARLDPKNDWARCNLGIALYTLGRKEEAAVELHRALAINPDLVQAHYKLGYYYRQDKKDPEQALVHYRNLAKNQPNDFEFQWLLAEVLLETGHVDEAAEQWGKALALCPDNDGNHARAARALIATPKLPKAAARRAVEFAKRAVELEPEDAQYQETLAAARRLEK